MCQLCNEKMMSTWLRMMNQEGARPIALVYTNDDRSGIYIVESESEQVKALLLDAIDKTDQEPQGRYTVDEVTAKSILPN